ncbi:protein bicaudal C homolog 1 isoform X1 [Daphnia magna]|uniref:protein bicaudal C homolog 1 isoform X1 n=1 Tax=Daphnia magna TaxID=35525 RepID=UPI0014030F6E|nr:protein bicaudal C homolog 1 isoform X1 [Daphnia magna]
MEHVMDLASEISESSSLVSEDMRTLDGSVDGEPRADGLYEERFRVDRRKLESMLLVPAEGGSEAAAERFFLRVMQETSTVIMWPEKLKVGSKSKRDPHVRVAGEPESVRAAKERIMAVLDTRQSNRVTLKMEVSYTDHSHIIGRGGNTISRVMEETRCHVHFPDSNRTNQTEKSNLVTVAGELAGVEKARARVRDLMPLVVMFELPITGCFQAFPDVESPFIQNLQSRYCVQVSFRARSRGPRPGVVVIKGSESDVAPLKEAVKILVDYFCGTLANQVQVCMTLEISPQHHAVVQGGNKMNLQHIRTVTGTTIMFPDLTDPHIPPLRKNTISIRGSLDSVLQARLMLMGSLPLMLTFDLREEAEPDPLTVSKLVEKYDVIISIKPKPKLSVKSVNIRGYERNAGNIYEARRMILGCSDGDEKVAASIPSAYIVTSTDPSFSFRHTVISLSTPTIYSVYHQGGFGGYSSPTSPTSACSSTSPFGYHHNLQPMALTNNCFPQAFPTRPPQAYGIVPGIHPTAQFQHRNTLSAKNLQAFNAYQTHLYPDMYTDFRQGPGSKSSSGVSSPTFPSGSISPCDFPFGHQNTMLHDFTAELQNRMASQMNDGLANWERDRRVTSCPDYEEKQLLALNAMRQTPNPSQARVPTPTWAGYGFSKSSRQTSSSDKGLFCDTPDSTTSVKNETHQRRSPWDDPISSVKNGPDFGFSSNLIDSVSSLPKPSVVAAKDLSTLLHSMGLTKYIELFVEHEIDLELFKTLTENELRDLGIHAFGVRRRMLLTIAELNKKTVFSGSAAPGAERRAAVASKDV